MGWGYAELLSGRNPTQGFVYCRSGMIELELDVDVATRYDERNFQQKSPAPVDVETVRVMTE